MVLGLAGREPSQPSLFLPSQRSPGPRYPQDQLHLHEPTALLLAFWRSTKEKESGEEADLITSGPQKSDNARRGRPADARPRPRESPHPTTYPAPPPFTPIEPRPDPGDGPPLLLRPTPLTTETTRTTRPGPSL